MDEQERREFEHDAAEHGIPLMLDRMGMDGLGNEVVSLYKRIAALEAEKEGLLLDLERLSDERETLQAERDTLRDGRCETCAHCDNIFCDNPESLAAGKLSPPDIEFYCNCWLEVTP